MGVVGGLGGDSNCVRPRDLRHDIENSEFKLVERKMAILAELWSKMWGVLK